MDGQQVRERGLTSLIIRKMQSKLRLGVISCMSEWLLSKRQETSDGEDVGKREPSYTVDGNVDWCSCYGNSMEISPKIKNRTIM